MSTQNTFAYPLYTYAVGWFNRQTESPLDFLAPALAVEGKIGTYKRYPKGYAFRAVDTRRALQTPAHAISVEAEDVPFQLEDHSLRIGVDDSELKPGAGAKAEAADQLAQSRINSLLATWRTSAIADGFAAFGAAIQAEAGKGNWSSQGDPVEELREILAKFLETNGVLPNRILLSHKAWNILAENTAILDRVAYNDAKVLTPELLLKLLDYEPGAARIMRSTVPVGTAKPGPGVAFAGANVLGSDMWLTFVDEGEQIGNMTGLRQFHMGSESPVESVESYYERGSHNTWYEVGLHRAFAVTAPSCNVRITIS